MEPATRKERLCVLSAYLTANPNQLYPLSYFSELFGAAKSTLSEDISIIRSAFSRRGIGEIEVMMGASGGVRFLPAMPEGEMRRALEEIAQKLESPTRILPGGFLYTADIFLSPVYVEKMAQILWNFFKNTNPDFIITVETKGIPLAMNVAKFFGKPVSSRSTIFPAPPSACRPCRFPSARCARVRGRWSSMIFWLGAARCAPSAR